MPWSKLKQDEVAVRRAGLLKLRRQGVRYDDERVEALGYSSPDAARKDLHRAIKAHLEEEKAEVGIYRQLENERLDELLEAAWPVATQPQPVFDKEGEVVGHQLDMRAMDTVLRLMDRRAKLNGLDMPVRAEVSGPGGGAVRLDHANLAELNTLIMRAGEPDPGGQDTEEDLRYQDEDEDGDGDAHSDGA